MVSSRSPGTLPPVLRSLADGELFGEVWGEGPPTVVALHGWRRDHRDFARALGPAARKGPIPTVAPDLPGFGATPEPPRAWGSADYAGAVADLITGADGPGSAAVVVGHSLGGRVGATLAAQRPDLVAALVLTGAPLVPRRSSSARPPLGYRAIRSLRRAGLVSEERMEGARRRWGSTDYRLARGTMRGVLVRLVNESYDEVLGSITCHVELLWGQDDDQVPVSVAEAICERMSGAKLTVCPGAGHLLPLERPDELREAVERALASVGT